MGVKKTMADEVVLRIKIIDGLDATIEMSGNTADTNLGWGDATAAITVPPAENLGDWVPLEHSYAEAGTYLIETWGGVEPATSLSITVSETTHVIIKDERVVEVLYNEDSETVTFRRSDGSIMTTGKLS